MASRPLVTVQSPTQQKLGTVALPDVLTAPIRVDLVQDVHTKMNKNHRQPYAVSKDAGEQTSARSWGTGRAVSRIPRVPGGGTHRSGQGAFGNMCRGGRMFAPNKVWRRWNVAVNKGQRRYAVCSALSASALAPLVMARGHRIEEIPEVPLVVSDVEIDTLTKTKEALALLQALGAGPDLTRVANSHHIRRGKGKSRNRRYVQRRGPLLIHNKERGNGVVPAFRNIAGVDTCNVNRLNLLQLAPGGHLGRFVIWTESAFKELDRIFGTKTVESQQKSGFKVPTCIMNNADVARVLQSQEIQLAVRPTIRLARLPKKKNPYNNIGAMIKLNPFELTRRRRAIASANTSKKNRSKAVQKNREFIRQLREPAIAPQRGEEEKFPF